MSIRETGSCTLEAGRNVTYWHMLTNTQMSERETVANGTKLRVRCPNNDYDYSVFYDKDTTDGENVSQEYTECVNGEFTKNTLACEIDMKSPPDASYSLNKCTTIDNGLITDRGKSLTCNTDYKPAFKNGMDAILYTRYSCSCNQTSGRLQCMGTEVECKPIGCHVPANVQQGMTLFDPRERRTISAANRYEIQHGQSLTFICEPSDVFYFEPNRRMFDCVKGSWVAKKRIGVDTWEFGNNGSFPECRKVLCPADYCKFGGHCIRDNECKCPEQTSGKQCQIPLCNPECQNGRTCVSPGVCNCPDRLSGEHCGIAQCKPECQNGGTCVSPDVCHCPDMFRGEHCEIETCDALLAPTNWNISSDNYPAKSTCEAPYCLDISKMSVCNKGKWDDTNIVCHKGSRVCTTDEYLVNDDSTFSASSQLLYDPRNPTMTFEADQARLYLKEKGRGASFRAGIWKPAVADTNQNIQVNFTVPKIITGISTQGYFDWLKLHYQGVTHYRFLYSIDCKTFITYTDTNGAPMIFPAYDGLMFIRPNTLPCPVLAMCARINPTGWNEYIAMKFDIRGCDGSSFTDI
ncbi:hypothetical protein DPMN_153812 [Dreissena polymorpha]|uniref:Uncharacterized protein n=1 Tax=Dreissena polymorpha TaxID=45954 RepID=A0A9D4FJU2_DREPO|nr:hypothetical protein DPMN_153812 [Dreissena polymorpha]